MDLSTLAARLEKGFYARKDDFLIDFDLILNNARLYFPPGSAEIKVSVSSEGPGACRLLIVSGVVCCHHGAICTQQAVTMDTPMSMM